MRNAQSLTFFICSRVKLEKSPSSPAAMRSADPARHGDDPTWFRSSKFGAADDSAAGADVKAEAPSIDESAANAARVTATVHDDGAMMTGVVPSVGV